MRSETSTLGVKLISKILILLILSLGMFSSANASIWDDLIQDSTPQVEFDCNGRDCNILTGTELVKDTVTGIETERTFSEYIQDIIIYLLTFISIIAVVYIIYAGFRILTSGGDDEVLKKQKSIIFYVIIGMIVIWLAYPITMFVISMFTHN